MVIVRRLQDSSISHKCAKQGFLYGRVTDLTRRQFPILIALGSNLSWDGKQPDKILRDTLAALSENGLAPAQISRFFSTPCFPAGAGPDYVNAAACLKTSLNAGQILEVLHQIEASFGRIRARRWGGRTLDLDLLAVGDTVAPDLATWTKWRNLALDRQLKDAPDQLILPHPRLQDRAFVLVPLLDVAADWRHPVLGATIAEMVAALPAADFAAVRPL